MTEISSFLIAAPSSNAGKTTVSLGLMRYFSNADYRVQPFKCGPDYIDTFLHSQAVKGNNEVNLPGINLDTWLAGKNFVKNNFQQYLENADIAIVEGVMGMFDGAAKMTGSSAEMATLLDIPVILVIDGSAVAYSVAPLLWGFKNFNANIKLEGVIFNKVNSESHYQILREAAFDVDVKPLGYIPKNDTIQLKSRHLGLNVNKKSGYERIIENAGRHIAKTVNLDDLLEITKIKKQEYSQSGINLPSAAGKKLTIAVASDDAFFFFYHDNLERLKQLAEIVYFSPVDDDFLPDCDMIYLAGGYPELHLSDLSKNKQMLEDIYQFCQKGGRVLAECGGFMYLGESIIDEEGCKHPMCGIFPLTTSMENPKLHIGYRNININGYRLKGHEFHYSRAELPGSMKNIAKVTNAKGKPVQSGVYRIKNVMASYMHFYWAEEAIFFEKFIRGAI